MFNPATRMPSMMLKLNNTEDLDDTLPIELLDLDCIDTATKEDWLTRETPLPRKVGTVLRERGDSSVFNPPLSSTRYKSDGSSSEYSDDVSTTAECGSGYEDDIVSAASQNNFVPSLAPAPSMDFRPMRCSTAVTANDLVSTALPDSAQHFDIRVDTCEFGSPKSTQRTESIEFKPPRCSTGLTEVRPKSPEEFYTCDGGYTVQEEDSNFVTAMGFPPGNSCEGGKLSTEVATSPIVEVTGHRATKGADADTDLSILMQCRLKIRNGRQIVSNVQAKPQIEFSVFKNSPEGVAAAPEAFQSRGTPAEGNTRIPTKRSVHQNPFQLPAFSNGTNCKVRSPVSWSSAFLRLFFFKCRYLDIVIVRFGRTSLRENPAVVWGLKHNQSKK